MASILGGSEHVAKRAGTAGRRGVRAKPAETAAVALSGRLTELSAAAALLAYHVENPRTVGLDAARAEVDRLLSALPGSLGAWDRERGAVTAAEASQAETLLASLKDGIREHRERLRAVNALKGRVRRG